MITPDSRFLGWNNLELDFIRIGQLSSAARESVVNVSPVARSNVPTRIILGIPEP